VCGLPDESAGRAVRMKASARIQVTLDVPIADVWFDGANLKEIREQAIASGLRRLDEILHVVDRPRIVGDPKVTIVLVEDV
jgi:hypothetical protein